jgi:hypothetical protein
MIITEEQLKSRYNITKHLNEEEIEAIDFNKDTHIGMKAGQFFLYETLIGKELSYPKLGLFIDDYVVDMALEVEWVNVKRTWEYNVKYKYIYQDKEYSNYVCDKRKELETLIIWDDSMFVYGVWDVIPDWKELKKAYERTHWFKRDVNVLRDLKLKNLLK